MPDIDQLIGLIFGGSAILTIFIIGGTCLVTLASFAFIGAILWFTLRPLFQSMQQRNAIMQSGTPATAVVVSLQDTGTMVNYQPQVRMVLQVHPPNGAPYQTDTIMVISQLQIPRVQPGAVVPVKIDPKDPAKVAVAI